VRPQQGGQPIRAADGQPLIQDHQPVWNSYPTDRWQPGEVVRDDYVLPLAVGVVPDSAHIVIYHAAPNGQDGARFDTVGELQLALR
jgi:AAA+ superfamily predicted ATPase